MQIFTYPLIALSGKVLCQLALLSETRLYRVGSPVHSKLATRDYQIGLATPTVVPAVPPD